MKPLDTKNQNKPPAPVLPAKPAVVQGPPVAPVAVKGAAVLPAKPAVVKGPPVAPVAVKGAAVLPAKPAAVQGPPVVPIKPPIKPAVIWPQLTMESSHVMDAYVKKVVNCWSGIKPKSSKENIVRELAKVLDEIHQMCGVPKTKLKIDHSAPTSAGLFDKGSWTMSINADMDINGEGLSSSITKRQFYQMVKTLYHEGRHTEQAWLARVQSLFEQRVWSASQNKYEVLNLPAVKHTVHVPDVFDRALNVALNRGGEPDKRAGKTYDDYTKLIKKIKLWYDAMTKNEKYEQCVYANMGMSLHWLHKYFTLPMEYDAFLLEERLREELKKTSDFKDVAANPPLPCFHCGGTNNQHVFSGLPLDKVK